MNEQVRNLCNKLETNRGEKNLQHSSYEDKIQFMLARSEVLIVVWWSLLGYTMLFAKNILTVLGITMSSSSEPNSP